jgi:hypothetical protein
MTPADSLAAAIRDRLAAQWIALGVSLPGDADRTLVDLEALIVMTALRGGAEPRLTDGALDWCVRYGTAINGGRLRAIAAEIGGDAGAVAGFAATVAAAGGPRWPVAVGEGRPYQTRGKTLVTHLRAPGAFAWRLRSAFGVAVRADIVAVLAASPGWAPSIAELAAATRSTKRNVAIATRSLQLGEVVEIDLVGNEQRVRLTSHAGYHDWLGAVPDPADWTSRFAIVEAVSAFGEREGLSVVVTAVEARALVARLMPSIKRTGLPTPDLDVKGDAFSAAFDAWSVALAGAIAPSARVGRP